MSRNSATTLAAVKLGIFTVVAVLVTALLTVIMGNFSFGAKHTFDAVFSSASMLQKGDDVRIAGIPVGEVNDVELFQRGAAKVRFTVSADVPLTQASRAEVRYLNIVGDRYLALVEGADGAPRLSDGATIPLDRTTPALNLTELYNGFQPLFTALDPTQVNELSMNILKVLQGEGGTVQSLLAQTASLTNALADRDQLIGEVIDNLSTMLHTVGERRAQLSELITQLSDWMTNLARDRKAIGRSIGNVSELTETVAGFLAEARPLAAADIKALRTLMTLLARPENKQVLTDLLTRLPEAMTDQTRIGTYGSWYNYYLCDFEGKITLPSLADLKIAGLDLSALGLTAPVLATLEKQLNDISFHSTAPRCQ